MTLIGRYITAARVKDDLPIENKMRDSLKHDLSATVPLCTVKGVQLAIADAAENADHLVNPEDAIRVALARQ